MIVGYCKKQGGTIVSACGLLGVSRQVYYRSVRSKEKRRQTAAEVVELVWGVRKEMPRLGTRKLHHLLSFPLGSLGVGRDKLFSIIRANHMGVVPLRGYRTTTNSHHRFRKHKNLVAGKEPTRPEQVWVSDITYVGTKKGHTYLSLVTDAYSKKVVGHCLHGTLGAEGPVKALEMAIKQRSYKGEALIHHSDRGIQYCCDAYQRLLKKGKMQCSMTETYDPYANAVAERMNGILKGEFLLETFDADLKTMKKIVAQSIDIYNNKRPNCSCHMMTPEVMHRQKTAKIRTYKKLGLSKASLGET